MHLSGFDYMKETTPLLVRLSVPKTNLTNLFGYIFEKMYTVHKRKESPPEIAS